MNLTASQSRAIKESGKNILVSAGAGSGKTGVLKERVIYKLKQGVHIDELIILTFTEAAAYEMKERIIKAINDDDSLVTELSRIDNSIISTYDAFTLKLVKQYHYLLDLPSNITIGDKIQFMTMEKRLLEETIKEYYLKNDSVFDDLIIRLFQKGDDLIYDSVKNFAARLKKEPNLEYLLSNYESIFFANELLEKAFDEFTDILNYKITKSKEIFKELERELSGYSEKSDLYLTELKTYLDSCDLNSFDHLASFILTKSLPRKISKKDDEYLKSTLDYYHVEIKNNIDEIKKTLKDYELSTKAEAINTVLSTKPTILKIVEITRTFLYKLANEKQRLNLYLFQDIMDLAIKLLEENPSICNQFKKNINEIMIDEYQDTNDLQEFFVSKIANNNLFMVGDIKQSIYGFRDANPKNFIKKYLDYSKNNGGTLIDLRENFRSRNEVLEDINLVFNEVMDNEIGGIDYQNDQSLIYGQTKYDNKIESQAYGIDVINYNSDELKEKLEFNDYVETESILLAKDIRNKIDAKYQIYDLEKNEFRDVNYADFAILVDRKGDFHRLAKVLSKYNIPAKLFSDEPYIESQEMLFLTNFINFINCFKDEEYLKNNFTKLFYGVSRSFVFKVKDQEIIDFIINNEINCINDLQILQAHPIFNNLYNVTNEIKELTMTEPVYDVLIEIYHKLDIYKMISYLDNPRKKEEKLDYFASLIKSFNNFTFEHLIEYLKNIETNKDWDIEYSNTLNIKDAVKIMTFHKSKGLQFPIVYLPFLNKGFNFTDSKDFFLYNKNYGLMGKAFSDGFYPTFLSCVSLYNNRREYISERIRLFYVANTRAMENIVIILDQAKIKPDYKRLINNYIDRDIRLKYNKFNDLISSTIIKDYDYKNKPLQEVLINQRLEEISSDSFLVKKSFDFQKKLLEKNRYSKTNDHLFTDEEKTAINYGKYVHKLLEGIDFNNLNDSLNKLPAKIKGSLQALLKSKIFDFNNNPKIYQEYEFYHNNTLGIIDLLVVYEDSIHIVDYKLKNISDEAYVRQLNGYKEFVKQNTNLPVYCYLYSIIDKDLQVIN